MSAPAASQTGFKLEAIFFPLQRCETFDVDSLRAGSAEAADENVHIGWDWIWVEPGRRFDVVVSVQRGATVKRPELVEVKAVGRFEVTGPVQSIQTEEFALRNATALLIPYVRQVFSQLTANGPFGQQLLQPINVAAVMQQFDPRKASAMLATGERT